MDTGSSNDILYEEYRQEAIKRGANKEWMIELGYKYYLELLVGNVEGQSKRLSDVYYNNVLYYEGRLN